MTTVRFDPVTLILVIGAIVAATTGHYTAGIILAALCGTFTAPIAWKR
ncbi:MAG: hypothetical protein NUW01_01625 [Gemmatimonadaceae bacterium]|nr:hypothetical protein [Gemmatimonadaceae bacterium]